MGEPTLRHVVVRASVTVRKAERADFPALARMLARAFADDPVTAWFYPSDRRRPAQARRLFAVRLRQLAPQREIYTTADCSGAALWTLPDRWREDARQLLMLAPVVPDVLPRLRRTLRAMGEIEYRHPSEPHFYLSVLGTDPQRRGEGIGSAVMRPVLDRCDADGVPAYLESSNEDNLSLYRRHGFEVRERITLPGGGPPLWLMWRAPR